MEKISRNKFMEAMDGRRVSLIAACVVGKSVLEKTLKSIEN